MPRQTFVNLPADKRQRIMSCLTREFAERSYTRASVDRVTAAAGISKGSFYQYFADKADAHAHLVGELMRARLGVLGAPVPDAGFEQTLTTLVHASHEFHRRHPLGWAVLARAYAPDSPLDPAAADPVAADLHAWAVEAVRAGQTSGELRDDIDPDTAAWFIERVLTGLPEHVMHRFGVTAEDAAADGSAFDRPEIARVAQDAVAMIVSALAPGRERP